MVTRPGFERGDIVLVSFSPAYGREQQGVSRPAIILSTAAFNRTGTALVAPITQGGSFAREAGFSVSLSGCGTETSGVVLVNQVRMVDLEVRGARKIETAPADIVEEALARLMAIVE
ncbi:type II toxin-antitoxin system ChpB family toxin [Scandinavium goeteborgense]|jgi:mRNA interferase ChpB|uniref:type II toxin-antitoxin system ChpB family toxin n=1 Tax=Scandinavium goeteborgense TaxID=1851514 RepID=UPI0021655257|nr:type II toxin-antitoxin system ChpB family toxin [Scandinavium goeteborgense]MCS2152084.1 type II toxin-antitoxin system ChpB family toxin [Scandinavium goeteborgense]